MQGLVSLVDEGRGTRPRARAVFASLIVFAATFLGGAILLRSLTPLYVEHPALRTKFMHFAEDPERYDTIFIGSSYVYRGIVPSVFDAVTAANGVPTTSFNFGVAGMRGLETEFVLERVLALEPRNLRWVLIAPSETFRPTNAQNWKSERFLVWHDLPHTLLALELLLRGELERYDGRSWLREHVGGLARHVVAAGRGAAWLATIRESEGEAPGSSYDGFVALDAATGPRYRERHESFLSRLDVFLDDAAALANEIATADRDLEPFERRYLTRLRGHVEEAGARAIFLIPPVPHLRSRYLVRAASNGLVPVTFNYTDPARYPEFYDPELRFDQGHFNLAGARRFTERLAADFARYATSRQGAPRRVAQRALRTGSR